MDEKQEVIKNFDHLCNLVSPDFAKHFHPRQ